MADQPRKSVFNALRPEEGTGMPLLDAVLDNVGEALKDARKTARGHVVNRVVGDVVGERMDAIMAARRRR